MDDPTPDSAAEVDGTRLLGVGAALAAAGGAVFLTWRKHAPVSRYYRRLKRRRE